MNTECSQGSFEFQGLKSRRVVGEFTGGEITSDGGGLLVREVSERLGVLDRFSTCFDDFRNPHLVEHSLGELVRQRVYGLVLGYGDLNDHDELRSDQGFAAVVGKSDVTGQERPRERDKGNPLASDSTLNRLELTPADANEQSRYKKIRYHSGKIEEFFVEEFLRSYKRPPQEITLDLDATDNPLHGHQEGRFFHGYYDCYCYLPLYIFCEDHLLCSKLRPANIDGAAGSVEQLEYIVARIRERWPNVEILVRGDSGFAREQIMAWCEEHHVHYVFGLAKNDRLKASIEDAMQAAAKKCGVSGEPARVFKELLYRTLDSWSRTRRVVAKAECLPQGENPRFIVTSLPIKGNRAKKLYERTYCARGDMENRIKEQIPLFAQRMSAETMRANQLRLWFAGVAYVIFTAFRRIALKHTELEKAQVETVRNKIFKIGALVKVSVRRVYFMFASGFAYKNIFSLAYKRIALLEV